MRVVVTGPRDYADAAHVYRVLGEVHRTWRIGCLIHGGASGADSLAHAWAEANGIPTAPYPVDHALDGPWPGAGPRRNGRMIRESDPDGFVWFPGGTEWPLTKGTLDCVRQCRASGLREWGA